MPLFARLIFGLVNFAARNGLAASDAPSAKLRARRTGIRGETFAYWYLRRHGYILVARNYTVPGLKGELDLVGYDGPVLAFVEVKTRAGESKDFGTPEDAVTPEKRHLLVRMARQFLAERRIRDAQCRFDVLAIESRPGRRPLVRLHKNAFSA
ncbi:MAG: YraN family protein [Acidobacteria bacterium]|nr:YraN family protein [Acidobacteriota bacterium]